MWVPKVPRPSDFCGCPPCGICFNWVEPAPPVAVEEEDSPIVMENPAGYQTDGVRKMVEDILGKDVVPTREQVQQVYEGAVLVHERNLRNSKKTAKELEQEIIDENFTRKGVESFMKQKAKEAATIASTKKVNFITCDSRADEEAKKEKEKVEDKVLTPPVRVKTPVASKAAPVDEQLLRRERKSGSISNFEYTERQRMIAVYKYNLEREKARWEDKIR